MKTLIAFSFLLLSFLISRESQACVPAALMADASDIQVALQSPAYQAEARKIMFENSMIGIESIELKDGVQVHLENGCKIVVKIEKVTVHRGMCARTSVIEAETVCE